MERVVHVLHQRPDILSGMDERVPVRAVCSGEHGAAAAARLGHGVAQTADTVALQRFGDEHGVTRAGVFRRCVGKDLRLQPGGALPGGQLRKVYTSRLGGSRVEALRNVSFTVEQGEYVAIMGESGSGKTTLLNILAALDEPTAGTVRLDGHELGKIREKDAAAFRRDNLGFVFQEFNLLDTFTLEDNIYLPLVLMGMSYEDMRARLLPIARELGLTELLKKYPYEVSGGQKQRAAVARAIITEPKLLLADEPTGALDSGSTDELLRLFAAINREGQTILMVTHSVKAASRAGRVLFIKDGQVFHQLYRGEDDDTRFYQRISDTLTMLQSGGEPA